MNLNIVLLETDWDKITVNSKAKFTYAGALIVLKLQNSFPPLLIILILTRYINPLMSLTSFYFVRTSR